MKKEYDFDTVSGRRKLLLAAFYLAKAKLCFSIGVNTPNPRYTRWLP